MADEVEDTQPPRIEKRVVVYVVKGRYTGLRRIIGHMVYEAGAELPKAFQNVFICTGEPPVNVQLVGEYPRYILYSEAKPVLAPKPPSPVQIIGHDGAPA